MVHAGIPVSEGSLRARGAMLPAPALVRSRGRELRGGPSEPPQPTPFRQYNSIGLPFRFVPLLALLWFFALGTSTVENRSLKAGETVYQTGLL